MNQFNKNVMLNNSNLHQQTSSVSQPATTDALIINSNSTVVSDELILQLQEQFGDSKQIYILNTSNNSVSSSSTYNSNTNSNSTSTNTIQYLIVDKDVDINAILQDPSIFQNQTTTSTTSNSNQISHQTNNCSQLSNNNNNNSNNNNQIIKNQTHIQQQTQQQQTTSQNQLLVEESIQRVQAPPPKRKQFEFKLDLNKKMSYQDAFLRYLAGEKQPTLEISTNEHANKKPKDSIYYNFYLNNPKLNSTSSSSSLNQNNQSQTITNLNQTNGNSLILNNTNTNNSNNTINNNNITNNNTNNINNTNANTIQTNANTNNGLDKENYYNSSRRENLLPLNNYEYRNSYKDHYDNQGVRLNPAIFKNLPSYSTNNTSTITNNNNNNNNNNNSNGTNNPSSLPHSSSITNNKIKINETIVQNNQTTGLNSTKTIIVTKSSPKLNQSNDNVDLNEILVIDHQQAIKQPHTTLNDHTYKSNPVILNNNNSAKIIIKESSGDQINLKRKSNNLNDISIEQDLKLKQSKLDQDIIIVNNTATTVDTNNQQDHIISVPVSVSNNTNTNNDNSNTIATTSTNNNNNNNNNNNATNISTNTNTNDSILVVDNNNKTSTSYIDELSDNISFMQGEFLIHKPTFSGDFDNYEIWCVLDEQYLQKYEPVLLSTGERCHQSADVLAQYTANKSEFLLVKVEEKGKTENNNIVVGVLTEYEPKNNSKMASALLSSQTQEVQNQAAQVTNTVIDAGSAHSIHHHQLNLNSNQTSTDPNSNVVVVTYDDLKSAFDVFLQVMSSQYLNGEFLVKIKELQDEYFKPSIEFIDTILNEKYNLLFNCLSNFLINLNEKLKSFNLISNNLNDDKIFIELSEEYKSYLENKPKLLIQKLDFDQIKKKCESFDYYFNGLNSNNLNDINLINNLLTPKYLVQFSGSLYDSDTLVNLNNNSIEMNDKQFFVCSKIYNLTNLLHSLKHFKIAYLEICSQKIESIKVQLNSANSLNSNSTDENSTNTDILNYCLADSQWLLEMFEKFKQLLFDVDNLLSNESSNDLSIEGSLLQSDMNVDKK